MDNSNQKIGCQFILIDANGVMPRIGPKGEAQTTELRNETPRYVYGEDNPELKLKFWNAVTGRSFMVQSL